MDYSIKYSRVLLDKRDLAAAGSTADVADFGPVPKDHAWEVRSVSCLNDSGAHGYPVLQLLRGSHPFDLEGGAQLTQYVTARMSGPYYVPEGCTLRVYLRSLTAAEIAHVAINGLDHRLAERGEVARG